MTLRVGDFVRVRDLSRMDFEYKDKNAINRAL